MPFPSSKEIDEALLLLLYSNGGPNYEMKSSDTYEPLANQFGLSAAERAEERVFPDDRHESKWNNMVQWSRNNLRKTGDLDVSSVEHGVWRLSPSGVARAQAFRP